MANRTTRSGAIKLHRVALRLAAYLWAAPNTLLGAMAGFVVVCLGGRVRLVRGVAEFNGGWAGRFFASLPAGYRFSALTLGHVILGIDPAALEAARRHEHIHVRQYECWGVFFLPAYVLSSVWQLLRGRRAYRDNFFERQACSEAAEE